MRRRSPPTGSTLAKLILALPLFFGVLMFAIPSTALATNCCACKKEGKNICLTTAGTCDTILKDANNPNTTGIVCDAASLGEPNSGQCQPSGTGIGTCDAISDAKTYSATSTQSNNNAIDAPVPFSLNIAIPGLQFGGTTLLADGKIQIPYLAQYISAISKYILGISVIAAAIMIVYGGFLYIVGSSTSSTTKGKEKIREAIIGLLIVFGAYTILATVNSDVLNLRALNVQIVTPELAQIETMSSKDYSKAIGISMPPFGKMTDGSCEFDVNQGGIPTVLSIYHCAVDVIAKETSVDACYLVIGINNESYLALPNSIGHDENALGKPKGDQGDLFPERAKFIKSGVTSKGKPITNPDAQLNDDRDDYDKPDLGLDRRFSHGGGLMQFTVKSICGKTFTKSDVIKPYGGVLAGAEHIKCNLNNQSAFETQQYPGTISMIWTLWGGCYYKGVAGKCPPFSPKMTIVPPGGRTEQTYNCIKSEKPLLQINPTFFTICRGDLPLDRDACRAYVAANLSEYGVDPKTACNRAFCDPRTPIICGALNKPCRLR